MRAVIYFSKIVMNLVALFFIGSSLLYLLLFSGLAVSGPTWDAASFLEQYTKVRIVLSWTTDISNIAHSFGLLNASSEDWFFALVVSDMAKFLIIFVFGMILFVSANIGHIIDRIKMWRIR